MGAIYSPNKEIVNQFKLELATNTPQKLSMILNQTGSYSFVFQNPSQFKVVVDLLLQMTNCHKIKHKLHKEDMITFKNRFEQGLSDQIF